MLMHSSAHTIAKFTIYIYHTETLRMFHSSIGGKGHNGRKLQPNDIEDIYRYTTDQAIFDGTCLAILINLRYCECTRKSTGVGNWWNYRPKLTTGATIFRYEQLFFLPDLTEFMRMRIVAILSVPKVHECMQKFIC